MMGRMFKELVTNNPQRSLERIDLLLRKTHQVGNITLNIPNIVATSLIQKLDRADPVHWTVEVLYILHHQRHEDKLFLTGNDRLAEQIRLFSEIDATEFPKYYVAIVEMLDAVEKKSQSCSREYQARLANMTSQLNSSPSPANPDSPSNTTPSN